MKRKSRIIASILVALMLIGEAAVGVVALDGTAGSEVPVTEEELLMTGNESQQSPENQEFENTGTPEEGENPEEGTNPEEPLLMGNSLNGEEEFSATATKVLPYNIKVTWTKVLEDEENNIYRVTEASGLIEEQIFDAQTTSFEFKGKTGVEYRFIVTAEENGVVKATAETDPIQLALQPGQVKSLYTYSSYRRIVLEWNKSSRATKYYVYRRRIDRSKYTRIGTVTNENLVHDKKYKVKFVDRNVANNKYYYYYVRAVGPEGYRAPRSVIKRDKSVKRMNIRITFRYSKRLTSHDAARKSHTFRKGQTVTAWGYGGGKYVFTYNGHKYFVSYFRIRNPKAFYTKDFNYTSREAEYFVNQSGQASSTKWLIWVSEYTQHCYVFKGSKGKWKIYDRWEISSGKASTPTPKGFNKRIHRKVANRHGLGPWTCFQSWSAFHGKIGSWKLGAPRSGGCVRNTNTKSRWIYKNIPMKTAVIIH